MGKTAFCGNAWYTSVYVCSTSVFLVKCLGQGRGRIDVEPKTTQTCFNQVICTFHLLGKVAGVERKSRGALFIYICYTFSIPTNMMSRTKVEHGYNNKWCKTFYTDVLPMFYLFYVHPRGITEVEHRYNKKMLYQCYTNVLPVVYQCLKNNICSNNVCIT